MSDAEQPLDEWDALLGCLSPAASARLSGDTSEPAASFELSEAATKLLNRHATQVVRHRPEPAWWLLLVEDGATPVVTEVSSPEAAAQRVRDWRKSLAGDAAWVFLFRGERVLFSAPPDIHFFAAGQPPVRIQGEYLAPQEPSLVDSGLFFDAEEEFKAAWNSPDELDDDA